MADYKTDAVVLRSRPYGEGHRLLTLYSLDRGKYTVLAKGVDKPRSKLAAGCQPFSHSRFVCWEGRSLDGVRQAQPVRPFRRLREDLNSMAAASFVAEMVDRLVQPEDPDEGFFGFLLTAFTLLDETSDLELGVRYIEWQVLDRLGFGPVLEKCVSCSRPLDMEGEPWHLSLGEGGVVCRNCGSTASGPEISVGTVRSLEQLMRLHPARLHVLGLSEVVRRQLAGLGEAYLEHILERPIRARDFMENLFDMPEG